MIADFAPQGPPPPPASAPMGLRFHPDPGTDRLARFFSGLCNSDRQVLALHFAEQLSPYEIHIIMQLPLSDVLCTIQRLRQRAHQSLQARG